MRKAVKQTIKSGRRADGKFQKGNVFSKGRPKGSTGKFTNIKASFLKAYEEAGGTKGLVAWIKSSEKNRAQFYQMITKLFPITMQQAGGVTLKVISAVPRIRPKEKKESIKDLADEELSSAAKAANSNTVPAEMRAEREKRPVEELTDEELDAEIQSVQKELEQ